MDTLDLIFGPLNSEQKRAVETIEGPVFILAGAGSGKTRALTHRIAYLIEKGVPPWQILAVTFTNKAASEMKERIKNLLAITSEVGRAPSESPMIGTFHSVCVRILRRDIEHIGRNRNFIIYDSDDQEKLMKETLADLQLTPEDIKPRTALGHIGSFKSEALSVRDVFTQATTHTTERLAKIYERYQQKLRDCNALDFDDLILETVRLFQQMPDVLNRYQETWKFLNIDEYQDTNHAQYLLVSHLSKKYRNLCIIGDPDQSIYAFRGADIRNILEFQHEYKDAQMIKLEQNYRSVQPILTAADAVIAANPNRPQKKMWTEKKIGPNIVLEEVAHEKMEAENAVKAVLEKQKKDMSLNNQVILYRTNAQSRLFEEACIKFAVPYRIIGGVKFYARREVKDVLAYLHVVVNPKDTISLLRIINVPSRKIGQTTLQRIQTFCNAEKISLWEALSRIAEIPDINEQTKLRLMEFKNLLLDLQERSERMIVSDLMKYLLDKISMEKWVKDDTEEGEARWENVLELLSVTHKYDSSVPLESLTNFLEEVALVSEVDKLNAVKDDALTLMTVHLCKGLEFESVIIVGCEEGLFPHNASMIDREQLEEERRLMYVAMTRAKEHLQLMHARSRMLWGRTETNIRSRFLDDIPADILDLKSDLFSSSFAWAAGNALKKKKLEPFRQDSDFDQTTEWDDQTEDMYEGVMSGVRVSHPHFGLGTVVSRNGDIAEIKFDSGQTKRLALNIAPLTLVQSE